MVYKDSNERKRAWYAAHRDDLRAKRQAADAANPERKAARKAYHAAWYAAHREKQLAYARDRYFADPAPTKASAAAWRRANPDRQKENMRAWRVANIEKCRARSAAVYAADPAKFKTQITAWKAANSERAKAARAAWLHANRDRLKARKNARDKENPGKARELWRRPLEELRDHYVASVLFRRSPKPAIIPFSLIAAKREHLKLMRMIKELKK